METSGVTNNQSNSFTTAVNQKILGKDDFFKLLLAELKHQDPLEPMKDREFIAQMASFSSLEQMQNMNKNLENFTTALSGLVTQLNSSTGMQQAVALIGKEIEFSGANGNIKGVVDSVVVEQGVPLLVVGEARVQLADVSSVRLPLAVDTEAKLETGNEPVEEPGEDEI